MSLPRYIKKVRHQFAVGQIGDRPFVAGLYATPGKAVAAAARAWGVSGRAAIRLYFYKRCEPTPQTWTRVALGVYQRGPNKFAVKYFKNKSRNKRCTKQFSNLKDAIQFRKKWAKFDGMPKKNRFDNVPAAESEAPAPAVPARKQVTQAPKMPAVGRKLPAAMPVRSLRVKRRRLVNTSSGDRAPVEGQLVTADTDRGAASSSSAHEADVAAETYDALEADAHQRVSRFRV